MRIEITKTTGIVYEGEIISVEDYVSQFQAVDEEGKKIPNGTLTLSEVTAYYDAEEVREYRNQLLASTDWWVLPDRNPTQEQLDYRQELRDLPQNQSELINIVWPIPPTENQ